MGHSCEWRSFACALVMGLGVAAAGQTGPALAAEWNDVAEVMDASLDARMGEYGVPGAVLVIVREGEVVYRRGYGFASLEAGRAVDPGTTLFRAASLSKPMTAQAAMTLVERGLLDLDTDIRTYLGDATPPTPYGPVTMRHLLTHTSGFDNSDVGDAARDIEDVLSLEDYVAARMTAQTAAPGELYRYSNPGFALAGRVIEVVSGVPFDSYMRDNVLRPSGMETATLAQDDVGAEAQLATGYDGERTVLRDFTQTAPADALLASGDDMASFLLTQMQSDMPALHERQFGHTSGIPAMALGWEESMWRGRRALVHSGGQLGFTSFMGFVPEERVGFFIALNSRETDARAAVFVDFLNAFMPRPEGGYGAPEEVTLANALSDYTGSYLSLDYPFGSFERMAVRLGLFGRIADVRSNDGHLTIDGQAFVPISADTFQAASGWPDIWRFERDGAGRVTNAVAGRDGFDRLPTYKSPMALEILLAVSFLAALLRGVISPLLALLRKRPSKGAALVGPASATTFAGFALLGLAIAMAFSGATQLDYGMSPLLAVALAVNAAAVLLVALAPVGYVLGWKSMDPWEKARDGVAMFLLLPMLFVLPYLGLIKMPW